jgi:cyclopropane fatty-acyl-phospholipid synthase-like methyltransferase
VTPENHADLVRRGYDQVAEPYLDARDQWKSIPYLDRLLARLRPGSRILDVGCGSGIPIDSYLTEKGHEVIGIDISPRQVELASENVPAARFETRDMLDLRQGEFSVDAVVSFYAIFHTPRESHAETLKTLATYLPPGGLVLVTMGAGEWEGEEDFHGAPMWWSHYGADKNKEFIEGAGFRVIYEEIDRSGDERHQIILAEKNELRYIGSRTTVMRG